MLYIDAPVAYTGSPMEFGKNYSGQWVATKGEKIIVSGKNLRSLMGRVKKRKDRDSLRYSLVPKGCIAGFHHGI